MSWFEAKTEKAKIPPAKALWAICPKCGSHFEKAVWKKNNAICPKCNYHGRLSARERIAQVADAGTFSEVFRAVSYSDHLAFHDATGPYKAKVEATIAKSGETESVVMGTAKIDGHPVMLGVMDFAFMGGSLGTGTGERIARACEQAIAENRPLVLFSASGGARMHEGILSLMQMAKGEDLRRDRQAQGSGASLHFSPHRPDDGRRERVLCDARRHQRDRAQGAHRLRRAARHREHYPPEASRRLPVGGVP